MHTMSFARVRGPRTQRPIVLAISLLCGLAACDSPVQPLDVSYTVGGEVSGLAGSGLVLVNNGGDNLAVSADGPVTFASALAKRGGYRVTVLTQPANPAQTCVVSGGRGTVTTANITTVAVACFTAGAASPFVVSSPVPGPSSTVVYVSLPPGAIPYGFAATISDLRTSGSVNAAVVDGGFDPVALPAITGDTLVIAVRATGGAVPTSFLSVVAAATAPMVVRTNPRPHTRDVSLNSIVVVVFSEPLDSATVDTGSVKLRRGTTPVPGTMRFADVAHLRAEFRSDSLLTPQTDYQLVLSHGIRDLNGLALDSAVTVPFTTGTLAPATNLVFASVSVGYSHTCGVTTAAAAYCWGDNFTGALGDGTTVSSTTPVPVAGGLTFATVSAAAFHTCGVTTSGSAYCWGVGGLLGDSLGSLSNTPLPVAGGLTFESVSAGYVHTCGVTTAGAAYCWGEGYHGELGDGTTNGSATAVPVAGRLTFAAVSAGGSHTCGVTTTGVAYCWGMNTMGELGTGSSEQCQNGGSHACSTMPVAVAGGLSFKTVIAAGLHSCGVTTNDAPYCWGDNLRGVLGTGTNSGPEQCDDVVGVEVEWAPPVIPCSRVPVAVAGELKLTSLTTGGTDWYACGLTPTGATYCWGTSPNGDLTPAPVGVAGEFTFATLSNGLSSTCGVTTAGGAYCWGANSHGELGDGTTVPSSVPVKVAGQP
jgi:alpha-tubulin suppressor-like RCC1 family protein